MSAQKKRSRHRAPGCESGEEQEKLPGHHKRLRKFNAGPVGKEAKGFLISQKEEKLEHFP